MRPSSPWVCCRASSPRERHRTLAPSFGGAGDFGTPQASGTARATVESYAAEPFVVVTELTLPDHWHVYYKNPGSVGMPMEASMKETPGIPH